MGKYKDYIVKEDYPFTVSMKTRWRDLDSFQHVNNAVYVTYIENARTTMFDRWGLPYDGRGKSIILVSLKIDYLKELMHPTSFDVCQRISRIGRTSFDIETAIFTEKQNNPICLATATSVCYDFSKKIGVPVFDAILKDFIK